MIDNLTEEELNKLFKQIADEHINLANEQLKETDIHLASSGLLYGAARFSAFAAASGVKNRAEYEAALESVVEHYRNLFTNMLTENLENYKSAFSEEEEPRYQHLIKDVTKQ